MSNHPITSPGLVIALLVLLAMTLFIFFSYPKKWQKRKGICILLILFHVLGGISMAMIFTCYSKIPFGWMKYAVSRLGTYHYLTAMLMFILFFTRFLAVKISKRLFGKERMLSLRKRHPFLLGRTSHSILFLLVSVSIATAGFLNIGNIRLAEYTINVAKNANIEDLDIVMLSDVHAGAGTWRSSYEKILRLTQQADPDVILIGGDLFDETTSQEDVQYVTDMLNALSPRFGIYYVYGNHDPAKDDWTAKILDSCGVRTLKDEMVTLGDSTVQLIGRQDSSLDGKPVQKLFADLSEDSSAPLIILQHHPTEFQNLSKYGSDLALAGHTHGINVPFALSVALMNDMISGSRRYRKMTAITSPGVGAWGFHYKWPDHSSIIHVHMNFATNKK